MSHLRPNPRILLISNSTCYGGGYLDHAEEEIRDFLRGVRRIAFVPFAMYGRAEYVARTRERLGAMKCS